MNDLSATLPAVSPQPLATSDPSRDSAGALGATGTFEMERLHIPFSEYLCERQQLAIYLLLAGEREKGVAEKIGVCRQTIWRWRKDIHFKRALAAGRDLAFGAAIDRLRGLVPQAVDRVEEQLAERNTLAPYRVLRLARADRPTTDDDNDSSDPL